MTANTATSTVCARCGADYAKDATSVTPGHGALPDGSRICYDCAAEHERAAMIATGRAVLYVTGDSESRYMVSDGRRRRVLCGDELAVRDWPGRLSFKVHEYSTGRHNIAGRRLDVWFDGPDGAVWHGVNIGDNELLRARRTKRTVTAYCT